MRSFKLVLGAALVAMGVGCSTTPQILDPVGAPGAKASGSIGDGHLVVNTATLTRHEGDTTDYYPHSPYRIYTESGKFYDYIPNHVGRMDESPTTIELPAGTYRIHARSDFGPVIVPAVISPDKTTEINLQSADDKMSRNNSDKSAVWMPKGPSGAYYEVGPRAQR